MDVAGDAGPPGSQDGSLYVAVAPAAATGHQQGEVRHLRRQPKVQVGPRVPDGSAGFIYMRDTRFAFSLDDSGEKPIMQFWSPPGWPDEVTSRGVEPNSLVVRQALLEHGKRFGVTDDGQVRYGQPSD